MCGITGFYSQNHNFSTVDLENMTTALQHRGPDANGYFLDEIVGLGHRRLSVLDLSENANQPMHSHDNRYVMIYNGEVYNYREIANELKSVDNIPKINFKTSSDSEIILEAFVQWGVEFVHKLNGMFAIAIYNKQTQELYLFRDRMGIKPLYYFWNGDNFVFASELKALLKVSGIPRKINNKAIYSFLNLGFIPTPMSIYESIYKMEAGSFLKVSKNGLEQKKYWSLISSLNDKVISNEKEALVKLSDLLISSVQYQLKSDVPFGVFLSGGIDSSLITAQAVNLSSVKVNTFSIGFEENRYNESEYAKKVANHLGTNHHEFMVSYKDAVEMIDDVFEAYGEPFSDSSAIPTMLVSKLAKKHVTVALSGEGGDELFFGYGSYKWAQRLNNPFLKTLRQPIGKALSLMDNRCKRAAMLFQYGASDKLESHIFSQEQYLFSSAEAFGLLNNRDEKDVLLGSSEMALNTLEKRKLNAMEKQALFDLHYYLPDDLLTKVDRASMHFSLETRVPYLDHRIVEFALNLSPDLKYRNGISKYLLKEILYQYLPKEFFARPKQGFAIPLEKWLKGELSYLITDYLSEKMIRKYDIVNYTEVEKLKQEFNSGKNYLYNRLWVLIVLHKWLEKNHPLN